MSRRNYSFAGFFSVNILGMYYMNFKIIAPPSHQMLGQKVAQLMGQDLIVPQVQQFADGELEVTLPVDADLKGKIVFVVQSTNPPVHDNLMQLLLLLDVVKQAGVQQIVAVIPYFGYARHDKSSVPGGKGSVAMVAQLFKAVGVDKVITLVLHAPHIKELFAMPIIDIQPIEFMAQYIKKHMPSLKDVCLVAPDHGAHDRVKKIAQVLDVGYILFTKERMADLTKIVAQIGFCQGTKAIIIDDMIDTGGTALNVCNALAEQGFTDIYGYFMHPVLSGYAAQMVQQSLFKHLYVSNSIELGNKLMPKCEVFDISELLVEQIRKEV